jgi:Ca2+/Na+ antiporter
LIGLSLGFSSLAIATGKPEAVVVLSPSIVTGFVFILINTVMLVVVGTCFNVGRIPKEFGYVMLSLYVAYVLLSVLLQFSKYGDTSTLWE